MVSKPLPIFFATFFYLQNAKEQNILKVECPQEHKEMNDCLASYMTPDINFLRLVDR